MDQAKFYKKQISLTEWLQDMGHSESAAIRSEDLKKYDRLEVLRNSIGLPYGVPVRFPAAVVLNSDDKFKDYLQEHADDLCMVRVVPKDPTMPKFRMRGKSVVDAVKWFKEQSVDPLAYDVYFVPHTDDHSWATIFVVNSHGIFGETVNGEHNKLTQGLYEADEHPIMFSFDFATWSLSEDDQAAAEYLSKLIKKIHVPDAKIRSQLTTELGATFARDYLCGYFETTSSLKLGTWFLDYSPTLGEMYKDFSPTVTKQASAVVKGQGASTGLARGRVHLVSADQLTTTRLEPDEILVCRMTTPDYLPLMQQAAGIVTDLGGILSHAAIVARELGKPCVTATRNATVKFKNGQLVEVDGESGVVLLKS